MSRYSAKKHFHHNEEMEKNIHHVLDHGGHINGQGRFPVRRMQFGNVKAGFASCEIIAVYNVLKDLNRFVPFSQLIYTNEKNGYMLAGGVFGTRISKIGALLDAYGIRYKKLKKREFVNRIENGEIRDGSIFIAAIRTWRSLPISVIHTFEMKYSRGRWFVYNRFNSSESAGIYDKAQNILKNGNHMGEWYCVYEIFDERIKTVKKTLFD